MAETPEPPQPAEKRATLSALLATATAALTVRTLARQVAKRTLGPVGLAITVGEALFATRAAVRAVSRWRAGRQPRPADNPTLTPDGP